MKGEFLLHKDKEENGKPSPQKQECGCHLWHLLIPNETHVFLKTHNLNINNYLCN